MAMLRPVLVLVGSLSVLTGLAYPMVVTGIAQAAFPRQAGGSLIVQGGQVRGSALIGQHTEDPKYFWGRLSATQDADGKPLPTNAANSGGSNLAPSNPDLRKAAEGRIAALRAADAGNVKPVPLDLVTASGSGLDPHISPAAAEFQVARVARARGLEEARVRELAARFTEGRTLGILGEPRVNVLRLNLALDGTGP
jgi:potassium-transporting ATPase KdpC subunit